MIRVLIALALLAGLFAFVGVSETFAALRQIEAAYVGYLLLISVAIIWASSKKWQLFVRAFGHEASTLHLMNLYTIGYFFNLFTPSYVGGDIARSYQLGRTIGNQQNAFVATFLERFTGLLAMVLLGVLFVSFGAEATGGVELAILIVAFGSFVAAYVCYSERWSRIAFAVGTSLMARCGLGRFVDRTEKLFKKIDVAMTVVRTDRPLFVKALLWSLVFHVFAVVNTYVAALAVGWADPSFSGMFIVVPLVLLVGMAPITPGGIGLQEGAFLYFLQRIGGSEAQSLGVGLVLRAKVVVVALIGGVLLSMLRKSKVNAAAEQNFAH